MSTLRKLVTAAAAIAIIGAAFLGTTQPYTVATKSAPRDLAMNVVDFGALPDDSIDDSDAIQNAIAAAGDRGAVVMPPGQYRISKPIRIYSHFDGHAAEILVTARLPVAVEIGSPTTTLDNKLIWTPTITQSQRKFDGTDVGLQVTNAYQSEIHIQTVRNFSVGLRVTANNTGNVYNNYFLSHLENNKVNLLLQPGNDGWVNENNFHGGRFSHYSSNGLNVSGFRHITIAEAPNLVNNNVFQKPSVEGDAAEFLIDVAGANNMFISPRFESENPNVIFRAKADSNTILYGYGADDVRVTEETGSSYNHFYSRSGIRISGSGGTQGVLIGSNTSSSNNPVFVALPAGSAVNTAEGAFGASMGANYSRFKRTTDAFPRLELDHSYGSIAFGNGRDQPEIKLKPNGKNLTVEGGSLQVGSAWNGPHMVMGSYHFWVDSKGRLRSKNGEPTRDTDGVVVGSQS